MHPKPAESTPAAAPVLPLEFTPFEYYYFLDDGPAYPTTFPAELHFSGKLDRERFRAALAAVVERHPLLAACADDRQRVPRWVEVEPRELHLDWQGIAAPLDYPAGAALNLRAQPALRTWVRADDNSARVVFEFHHAACDGLAGLQFVQDFLASYRAVGGEASDRGALRPVDAELLRGRGAIVSDEPLQISAFAGLRDAWYTLKVWSAILFRAPQVVAAPKRTETAVRRNPLTFEVETFSEVESSSLRRAAERLRVTTNDLLLRDFLLVLKQWNADHGAGSQGRLRINVPVNVRTRADAAMPVANRIGYGFVTAKVSEVDDPRKLLEVVKSETGRIKDWKLALYFLGGLAFGKTIPGLLPWAMRRRCSFATAVLSNVGRFNADPTNRDRHARWTCGDLTLEWIGGVPPVRQLTRAAVIVIDYAGRTSLCLRTDPHYFDAVSSRKLLDALAARVRQTLGETD